RLDLGYGHGQAQAVGAGAQQGGIADNIERRQRGLRTTGPSCKQDLRPYARRLSHGDDQRQGRRAVIHTLALSASFVPGTLNPFSRCRQHHLATNDAGLLTKLSHQFLGDLLGVCVDGLLALEYQTRDVIVGHLARAADADELYAALGLADRCRTAGAKLFDLILPVRWKLRPKEAAQVAHSYVKLALGQFVRVLTAVETVAHGLRLLLALTKRAGTFGSRNHKDELVECVFRRR